MIEKHKIRAGMLLVRPSEVKEETTAGGLIIPVSVAAEPNNGRVVLVGKPLPTDPHDIHTGDVVYYADRAGQEITLYDVKYRLLMVRETLSWIPKNELDKLIN